MTRRSPAQEHHASRPARDLEALALAIGILVTILALCVVSTGWAASGWPGG